MILRVAGEALVDRDDDQVVKDAFSGKDVDDLCSVLRIIGGRLLARHAEVILHRGTRPPSSVGRTFAPRHTRQVEHGHSSGWEYAGVISERPLATPLAWVDAFFQHDLGLAGTRVHRHALDDLDAPAR